MEWTPEGRLDYLDYYPYTPNLNEGNINISEIFVSTWNKILNKCEQNVPSEAYALTIVLVKGIFGDLMPGNFNATYQYLKKSGLKTIIIKPKKASASIMENAQALKDSIENQIPGKSSKLLFLTHSKGGLDTLWAMLSFPDLYKRTMGMAIVQCTREKSVIMERILFKRHTFFSGIEDVKENILKKLLYLVGYKAGCLELTSKKIHQTIREIDKVKFDFPVISVATWSIKPTSWLDSYHKKLGQIRPGCAHDGQFFLEDQVWPQFKQIILGNIDHAQPAMGGNGFDDARFWLTILNLFFNDRRV